MCESVLYLCVPRPIWDGKVLHLVMDGDEEARVVVERRDALQISTDKHNQRFTNRLETYGVH